MKRSSAEFQSHVHGGSRQRIAKQVAVEAAAKQRSSLVEYLLCQWSWGLTSTPQAQRIAKMSLDDLGLAKAGVLEETEVEKLAGIGCQGSAECFAS